MREGLSYFTHSMKRRTALKRVVAGAGSTVALVGTAASQTSPSDGKYNYRVTENGIERLDGVEPSDDYCHERPDCCVEDCDDCAYDCYDGCHCVG